MKPNEQSSLRSAHIRAENTESSFHLHFKMHLER